MDTRTKWREMETDLGGVEEEEEEKEVDIDLD